MTRVPSRRLSKSCKNIRKYGERLQLRRRQRGAELSLTDDLDRLREQLSAVDRHLTLLDSISITMRQNAETSAMNMIKTYFHHMQRGFDSETAYDRDVTRPFICAMLTEDVKCQDFSGRNFFFEQWEFITKAHESVTMTNDLLMPLPVAIDDDSDVYIIKACGATSCRITRDALTKFFPHILRDEELVQWLIGKEYSYGYTMVLHVNTDGRVYQFESSIDLTAGLFSLMQDPQTTIKMVQSSKWTKGGNLSGFHPEVQECQYDIPNSVLS
ncbi:hypothetical protein Poli38472_001098 [Pythium oligandrum]|uniref:Uncharacterized protein n=1 Tax=Pythium oligandrum TaxID=41045 RepID=A0A8K1FRF2_PYTOL|nr:hypothetical protein Poli38472_001098 [Pythium oligandrum]|eukprot:TMW68942.1 hypothetical protein Poli38472_001098 [Pythium oligandrum]